MQRVAHEDLCMGCWLVRLAGASFACGSVYSVNHASAFKLFHILGCTTSSATISCQMNGICSFEI